MTAPSVFTRRAALAAMLLAAAGPAMASSKKKEDKKGEGEGPPPEAFIKMQPFAAPIVENGKLINYIFLNLSLKMAEGVPVTVMDGQEPVLRDAIVRAAYKTPFNKAGTYNEVDEARLKTAVLSQVVAQVGRGKVATVEITKQIARKQLPLPGPAKPKPATTTAPSSVPPTPRGRDIVP